MDTIENNMTVILQKGQVLKAERLEKGRTIVFEKMYFTTDNAFSKPFNSYFEVSENKLHLISAQTVRSCCVKETESSESVGDNRLLLDEHGKSQVLKREEIIEMRSQGATGKEIVETIVNNSASFVGKTVYSQKKYLKKKQKKHFNYVRILKPCARLVCQMYENREPAKIGRMTTKTMSQIVTMANVKQGSNIIVVETCSGVLLGLLMQCLAGKGSLVNLHVGETPSNLHAVTHFNFTDDYWNMLHSFPLVKVGPLLSSDTCRQSIEDELVTITGTVPTVFSVENELDVKKSDAGNSTATIGEKELSENTESTNRKKAKILTDEEKAKIRLDRRTKRLRHQYLASKLLSDRNMDSLIIACRFHPTPIALSLISFLAPSRPFVVYCEHREPLMELFIQISLSGKAVNLKLSETFSRHYQILPEQTHPKVMLSSSGGYLLTGITVEAKTR